MKWCKLEYKTGLKWVAARAKTERQLISFNESLLPPIAEATRWKWQSLIGQEWSGWLRQKLVQTCMTRIALEIFMGYWPIYQQVKVRRWQLQGVSLHDTDNSCFEANNLHVHKYRLRCPKLHIRNYDFLLSCLTCECYFVICYSVCGVSLSLSALLCITRWHQCQ